MTKIITALSITALAFATAGSASAAITPQKSSWSVAPSDGAKWGGALDRSSWG